MCVQIWGLKAATPYFTLKGHERGVNCIGYFRGGDRPYLVSGGDDQYAAARGGLLLSGARADPSGVRVWVCACRAVW